MRLSAGQIVGSWRAAKDGQPWVRDLSLKQREFYEDTAKRKAAVAGRRGGKTWVVGVGLCEAARTSKGALCPYVALSQVSARRNMWPVLEAINEKYKLVPDDHMNRATLSMRFPEGGEVFCVGADDLRKVEALRGMKCRRVAVDETGSFPRSLLQYLLDDVLTACLMDLDGELWITGTPNASCAGYFHDLTTGSNPKVRKVPTYTWNMLDNTSMPHAARWLAELRAERNWTLETPTYRREYLGHWVRDNERLVLRFDRARHCTGEGVSIPELARVVFGVDLGTKEDKPTTALTGAGWARHDRTTYGFYAEKRAGMNPETTGRWIEDVRGDRPKSYVVVDEGGLGRGYANMWRTRPWGPSVVAAEKRDKLAYIDFLNADLDANRIKLDPVACAALIEEIEILQWNDDHTGPDDQFEDHAFDSFLYAWRDCYAWAEKNAAPEGPARGTREALLADAAALKKAAIAAALAKERKRGAKILKQGRWDGPRR